MPFSFKKQWIQLLTSGWTDYRSEQAVRNSYNAIAGSFEATRRCFWPEFSLLGEYIKDGDKILDLACGSGRLVDYLDSQNLKVDYYGLDSSDGLLELAKNNHQSLADKFTLGQMTVLPYADNYFDVIVCFAGFHHLATKKERLQALSEMKRVLKPQGKIVMTNWYLWGLKFLSNFFKAIFTFAFFKDLLIAWKGEAGKLIWRYYHAFTIQELNRLFYLAGLEARTTIYLNKKGSKRNLLTIAEIKHE